MLVILSGCSGAGKNTIINELLQNEDKYRLMATFTTRNMRPGEEEGKPYHFVTKENFEKRISEGEFYEYENVHGNYYGTSKKLLMDSRQCGKILLKDIDVKGTENLVKVACDDINIVTFFIGVSSRDVLIERLVGRGEKDIDLRLSRYDLEMGYADKYNYFIENTDLHKTVGWIESLIEIEKNGGLLGAAGDISAVTKQSIGERMTQLQKGEDVGRVRIAYDGSNWYVVEGYDAYIAALALGTRISRVIADEEVKDINDKGIWENLINETLEACR